MIIGRGDIATVLQPLDEPTKLFFASGVSNSQETRESEYQREKDLLLSQNDNLRIIYFSSFCVFYSDTRYARHKREMESMIKNRFTDYNIVRIGNITWGDNPHTLINYFKSKIYKKEPYEVQDVYRYIVDKDEFLHWVGMIPSWNCEMNITGKRMKVRDIINTYCFKS